MARVTIACFSLLLLCIIFDEGLPAACPALEAVTQAPSRPLPRPRRQYLRYTTRYDRIDVDRVLSSRRLVRNYVECILDRKPCPPDGAELKKLLPDALHNNCSRCTQKQKAGFEKAMAKLSKDYKEEWLMLLERYDPDKSYRNSLVEKKAVADKPPTAIQTR